MITTTLLLASGLLNGIAQILWKKGTAGLAWHSGATELALALLNPFFISGLIIYGVSIVVWLVVLSKTEVSFAYPFLAISFIVVLIGGYWLWEHITAYRLIGVACIIVGIFFISRS